MQQLHFFSIHSRKKASTFFFFFIHMAQMIVVKVEMHCFKCRRKALQIAAAATGVNYVGVDGDEKEKIVVKGDGVDVVTLVTALRKKVGHADIITLADDK